VPSPDVGVPSERAQEARRRVLSNRRHSSAGRRFWELSGGVLFCPCGRRIAAHTAPKKGNYDFYYVCGLRRSNHKECEHGTKYHRAEEPEKKVRALVLGFVSKPDEVRRRVEEYVRSERNRLSHASRELDGWERRMRDVERRCSNLIDLAADETFSREDLTAKLDGLDREREATANEIAARRTVSEDMAKLEELPELAESLAQDLPYLLDRRRVGRDYETSGAERTPENPLGLYKLTPDRIWYLPEEDVARREQEAEDERAAR
jgi:hypothetical protein